MRKLLPAIGLCLFLISCEKKPVVIPADVIPKDSMITILADMHIAEAMLQLQNLSRNDSTRQIAIGYYKTVFEKHRVSEEHFNSSFRFYLKQPEILSGMYDSVITRLSATSLHAK